MAVDNSTGLDPYQKDFVRLIRANAHRHRLHEVFRDFCEIAAISLSNAVDRIHYDKREARYLEVIKGYTRDEVQRFPVMLAAVVDSLECGFQDSLGQIFMALDLGGHWHGQFFTPYHVAHLMAQMVLLDARCTIERDGFLTLNEPAVGAGAMVIASAHALRDQDINYQKVMHVVAQDIDLTAVHMAYIQLSLLHIPAFVIHGNTLAQTEWEHWATPAHILGAWDLRLRGQLVKPAAAEAVEINQVRALVAESRIERAEQMNLFV